MRTTLDAAQNVTSASILLSTGARVPQVGLGVWQARGSAARRAVSTALSLGYRHVDTAGVYGNESDVGEGLRDSGVSRAEVFITTKLWNADQGYDSALLAFDASLGRLGLEYVDLYLLHWSRQASRSPSSRPVCDPADQSGAGNEPR
jgi:diketogulonate reductase-like aldo/keto reductase